MAAFQAEFWAENREQSIGAGFYVEALGVERESDSVRLEARVWLAPFDQGVVQDTVLEIAPGANPHYCDIDVRLQLAAHRALEGRRGAAVAIEPGTGDILALVSMPTFDPNRFAVGLTQADFQKLNNDPDKPLFQRALTGHYPPGSTIKPFLGLAALHYEVIDPDSREMCPGHFILPGTSHRYRDWKGTDRSIFIKVLFNPVTLIFTS